MFATEVLVPIFICVILPVSIVLIIGLVRRNETNRKAEIMLKAIENGVPIDPEVFKTKKKKASIKKDLLDKLNGACITSLLGIAFLVLYFVGSGKIGGFFPADFYPIAGGVLLAVGIGLFVSYFVGKKMMAKEIEAEENNLNEQE